MCFQPYFRSSRASVWGCDLGGATRLPPHSPIPHCAWVVCSSTPPPTPSRGPEPELRIQQVSEREASLTTASSDPSSEHVPPLDQRLQRGSLWYWQLFYGQSKEPRRLENMCLITHLAPVRVWRCETVDVRLCAARESCWQCAISVCLSVHLCCVKRIFFQINVARLESS